MGFEWESELVVVLEKGRRVAFVARTKLGTKHQAWFGSDQLGASGCRCTGLLDALELPSRLVTKDTRNETTESINWKGSGYVLCVSKLSLLRCR